MDTRTVILVLTLGLSLIVHIVSIVMNFLMKFNDLKHLEKGQTEIKEELKATRVAIIKNGERISRIEGKMGLPEK